MDSAVSIGLNTDLHVFIEIRRDDAADIPYSADSNHQFHIDTYDQLITCESVKCERNSELMECIVEHMHAGVAADTSPLIIKHLYDYRDYYHTIAHCNCNIFKTLCGSMLVLQPFNVAWTRVLCDLLYGTAPCSTAARTRKLHPFSMWYSTVICFGTASISSSMDVLQCQQSSGCYRVTHT